MGELLYTIGKAAALCNISENQLRNYDKMGLLSPQARGDNNYRYYTERQLEDILVIKELKALGFPLKTIESLIRKESDKGIIQVMEELLSQQRAELQKKQKQCDALVDRLLMLSRAEKYREQQENTRGISDDFNIVSIAERPIISLRKSSKCHKTNHYTERYLELQNLIEKRGIQVGRSWFILYHEPYECIFDWGEDAEGDMEFFANLEHGSPMAYTRIFGGFQAACATYLGPYTDDKHKETYDALAAWARQLGYKVSGIAYEELLVGRYMTNDEKQYVTKLYLPVNVTTV